MQEIQDKFVEAVRSQITSCGESMLKFMQSLCADDGSTAQAIFKIAAETKTAKTSMSDAGADCPDTTDALAHMSALLDVTRTYSNFIGMIEPFELSLIHI
eukprot:4635941-Prorocentrum_lima.AAC.1